MARKVKNKQRQGICVYCWAQGPVTRDHIPPKSLFEKPRPTNLITVDSCEACNTGFSKDDDYFWLHCSAGASDHSEAASESSVRVFNRLTREESTGFRNSFFETVRPIELTSDAGLYLGASWSYDVSLDRLNRVASRIVRGLFSHLYGRPLPREYIAEAMAIPGFSKSGLERLAHLISSLAKCERHAIGTVFAYRVLDFKEEQNTNGFFLEFYENIEFVGWTRPPRA